MFKKCVILVFPLLALFLQACGSLTPTSQQKTNRKTFYRHDLCFSLELPEDKTKFKGFLKRLKKTLYRKSLLDKRTLQYCGVAVLPHLPGYKVTVHSKEKMDFFVVRSCHEEATTENLNKGIFKNGKDVTINYSPTIERGEACAVTLVSYSKGKKYSSANMVFENPEYQLDAILYCNGFVYQHKGVSICHGREGLVQRIDFMEPVAIGTPVNGQLKRKTFNDNCPPLPLTKDKRSTGLFKLPNRECVYPIIGLESGKIHQFNTSGYEGILLRE